MSVIQLTRIARRSGRHSHLVSISLNTQLHNKINERSLELRTKRAAFTEGRSDGKEESHEGKGREKTEECPGELELVGTGPNIAQIDDNCHGLGSFPRIGANGLE